MIPPALILGIVLGVIIGRWSARLLLVGIVVAVAWMALFWVLDESGDYALVASTVLVLANLMIGELVGVGARKAWTLLSRRAERSSGS
jgi:hypothetical protein